LTVAEADSGYDTRTELDYVVVTDVLAQQAVSPESAVTVEAEDASITVEVPEAAVVDSGVFTIRKEPETGIDNCPSGFKAGATRFSIELTAELATDAKITISVKYCEADLEACGGDPELLTLSRYDEGNGKWIVLPTVVDAETMTLTATTDKLSKWMVMVRVASTATHMWAYAAALVGGLIALAIVAGSALWLRRRVAGSAVWRSKH